MLRSIFFKFGTGISLLPASYIDSTLLPNNLDIVLFL